MKNKTKVAIATVLSIGSAEIIVGQLDWWQSVDPVPVELNLDQETVDRVAKSSLYLDLGGSRCSGSVIGHDLIITNYHCIGAMNVDFKVTPDYVEGTKLRELSYTKCKRVKTPYTGLDYSVAECPGLNLEPIRINVDPVIVDSEVFLVHQNCDYFTNRRCKWTKKVSYGHITKTNSRSIKHSADTLGGSSGSPVFNKKGELIALHNLGFDGNHQGRGSANGAVNIRRVVESMPKEIRDRLQIKGDRTKLQQNDGSTAQRPTYKPVVFRKKSFKCRYFSWLFRRSCR